MATSARMCAPLPAVIMLIAFVSMPASAGIVDVGGGWQAIWDPGFDGLVDINPMEVSPDGQVVFIQKSAQFTLPPSSGIFPSVPIVFRQTSQQAARFIVIDDEIVTNSTGFDWTDFHMDLMDHGDATFDPQRTAASGGGGPIGFSISPFTTATFRPDYTRLDIAGGTVPDGGVWFPGATGGQLWISVKPSTGQFTQFVLKETPTPEPATMLLLLSGAIVPLIKRRRRRTA